MHSLRLHTDTQACQTLKTITFTAILDHDQLLGTSNTTWSNLNIQFCGAARDTSIPTITPLDLSGSYPSTYGPPNWPNQYYCLFILKVPPLDRPYWNPSVYIGSYWTIQVDCLIFPNQFDTFKLLRNLIVLVKVDCIILQIQFEIFCSFRAISLVQFISEVASQSSAPIGSSPGNFHPFKQFD